MKDEDLDIIQKNGDDLIDQIQEIIQKKFGKDAFMKDDVRFFQLEAGSLSYAINHLNSIIASLLIQRLVEQGETADVAAGQVAAIFQMDALEMAEEGRRRYEFSVKLAEHLMKPKKSTSH